MMSPNYCIFSNFRKSLDTHYVGIGNGVENARSLIVGPDLSFNFHSSNFHFFKICGAHLSAVTGDFSKKFGTYAYKSTVSKENI